MKTLKEILSESLSEITQANSIYIVANGTTSFGHGIILVIPLSDALKNVNSFEQLKEGFSQTVRNATEDHSYKYIAIEHTSGEFYFVKNLKDDRDVSRWLRNRVRDGGDINYLNDIDWSDLNRYL